MADRDRRPIVLIMPLTGVATQKGWNPPEKEISRRNGGKGVDKEKCSNKRSLLAKTGELAGMVQGHDDDITRTKPAFIWLEGFLRLYSHNGSLWESVEKRGPRGSR